VGVARRRVSDFLLASLGVRLAVWVLVAKAFLPGVLNDPANAIAYYHDEHNCVMHEEVARRTVVDYHQLPAWNPYFCGGIPKLANPPDDSLSPDMILRFLWGTIPGRRLAVFFFVIVGLEGVFRYARRHDASVIGAAAGAVAFGCCGYYVALLRDGWVFMFTYQLLPWVCLAFERGIHNPMWRVAGGLLMAWIVMCGGTYVAPFAAALLGVLLVFETVRAASGAHGPGGWYKPALALATMAGLTVGLTAIRVWPMMHVVLAHPRLVDQLDQDAPFTILARVALGHGRGPWHVGSGEFYVGSFTTLLAVLGALAADRKGARFLAIAAIFLGFACGEIVPFAPYVLLRKLPLFSQLRFPFRYTIVVALFVALASTRGLTRLEDALVDFAGRVRARLRGPGGVLGPGWRAGLGVVGAALAATLAWYSCRDVLDENFVHEGVLYTFHTPLAGRTGFRQSRGNRWDAQVWTFANLGSLHCFEENDLFESPRLRGDLSAEEFAPDDPNAKVERLVWSPNKLVLRVTSEAGARVVVNQNHHEGWRSNVGKVESDGGLLSVRVPAGVQRVELRFRDWRILAGGLVSAATGLGIAAFAALRARRWLRAVRRWLRRMPTFAPG
jgi:hypothetical protein